MTGEPAELASLRLDRWLWFARFCKTRALAQKLIEHGQVTLNGAKVRKVSANIRPGDVVVLVMGPVKRTITVRALAARRGSATDAAVLYDEAAPLEKLIGLEAGLPLHKPLLVRPRGAGRPTKKDRRAITKHIAGRFDDA